MPTPFDADLLRRLWACRTITADEIGRHFGMSGGSIRWRAKCLGLPPRSYGPVPKVLTSAQGGAELRRMWGAGMPIAAIAARFGVSRSTVTRTARGLGLPPRRRIAGQGGHAGWGTERRGAYRESELARAMAATARAETARRRQHDIAMERRAGR